MKNILIITSSLNPEGNSTRLAQQFQEALSAKGEYTVTTRDVGLTPLPHLSGQEMGAWMTEAAQRTPEQIELAAISDNIVEELQSADVIVFATPMYNFGIPSTLKAYIDRICRAGVTFRYTETGPVGLLENKKAIILAARGGIYSGTDKDTQSKYLQDVLGFIGISEVDYIYAEGLAMGEEPASAAWANAATGIQGVLAAL